MLIPVSRHPSAWSNAELMPLAAALPCLSTARSFRGCSSIPSEKGSLCFANEFATEYVRIGSLLALVLPNATKSFLPLMESK